MRAVRLTTADDVREPVRVEALTSFGRVAIVDRPDALESMIRAARTKVERYAGVVLVPGTFLVRGDRWTSVFDLPLFPVTGVTAFRYIDQAGATVTLDAADYVVDVATESSRVVLTSTAPMPYNLRALGGVELEVTAGYAEPEAIPEDIRQLVLRAALMTYEHRDDPALLGEVDAYIEAASSALCAGDLV